MNKENQYPDKGRDKPPPLSQNPPNPQKSKTSVFIIGDSIMKKVDGYLLTSFLKHQYLVKTRHCPTAKTIDTCMITLNQLGETLNQKFLFCTLEQMIFFFFSIWVFFHEHSRFTGQQGKGEGYLFNSSLPLPPASQTLRY